MGPGAAGAVGETGTWTSGTGAAGLADGKDMADDTDPDSSECLVYLYGSPISLALFVVYEQHVNIVGDDQDVAVGGGQDVAVVDDHHGTADEDHDVAGADLVYAPINYIIGFLDVDVLILKRRGYSTLVNPSLDLDDVNQWCKRFKPPNPIPHHQPHPSPFFPFSSFLDLRNPATSRWFLGPPSPSATPPPAASSNSSNQFDVHLGGLLSGGATIQIFLEGSSFPGGFISSPAPGAGGVSLVDYFMGSGLKQLIQQLAENDRSRYDTMPTAKAAVAALPDVAVDGGAQHVLQKDCILPWLDLHSSSPSAAIYVHQCQAAATAAAAPAAPGGCPSPRVMVRRFRISLPWPLRAAFGAQQAESSDQDAAGYGDYQNDGNASGRSYDDLD
ncbi:E3 ubiquitin-protein ligase RING1-like [Triticum aestivum]|uniref:E3 ubiquitin-protein ligase RING1-like n=1 Tax=Triticum aestivum TaxID=4565 RepID=UPI001D004197|nr:E3 ubiquitin-protein ligase RING1-like [Triticum aestivum]